MKSKYISINKKIQFGDPCIKGTRINVFVIAGMFEVAIRLISLLGYMT